MDHYKEKSLLARKRLHVTVYCQCFSPCGKYLVVGNSYGDIVTFSLTLALSKEATEDSWKPHHSFKASKGPIYTLSSTEKFLISAGSDDIQAWNWTDIITRAPKCIWLLSVPTKSRFENPETNCLAVCYQNDITQLFAGCGDNAVHMWDIETGSQIRSFEGHTDYIHSLVMRSSGKEIFSASEDGTVRMWDVRVPKSSLSIIEPYKQESLARPHLGKFIATVDVDAGDDWMICGGGPCLSMWHLRTLAMTTVYESGDFQHQHALFNQDSVISGGTQSFIHHWAMNGDSTAKVPCSPTSVFSIAINDKPDQPKVMSIAGDSHKVDICMNFGYKAFSLSVM